MNRKNNNILIVDDNPSIHEDFQKILRGSYSGASEKISELKSLLFETNEEKDVISFEVSSAFQGQEALELIRTSLETGHPYQLAFIDIRMPPGWDGVETTKEIFKVDPNIQVVICSAYADYSWQDMQKELGFSSRWMILKKPFDAIEACQLAHSLCEKWTLNMQAQMQMDNLQELVSERTADLEDSLSQLKATFEATTNGILTLDKNFQLISYNQKFIDMWCPPQFVLSSKNGTALIEFIDSQLSNNFSIFHKIQNLQDQSPHETFDELYLKNGKFIECYTQPQIIEGKIIGRVWSFRDLSERRKIEEINRLQNRAFQASSDGILIFSTADLENKIIYANPAFEKITGYTENEITGLRLEKLLGIPKEYREYTIIEESFVKGNEAQAEFTCTRKDGTSLWVDLHIAPVSDNQGIATHFVGIFIDITEKKRMLDQLAYQATHDLLTGLPNRVLLMDRIQQAIAYAKRFDLQVAILFIDFDRFKLINDSLGHDVGDALLCEVAKRLLLNLRQNDTIARLGGDEFVAVLTALKSPEDAQFISQKILKSVGEPYQLGEHELTITVSIGITSYPFDGNDNHTLLKNADAALYYAKELGGNTYQVYAAEMSEKTIERLNMENDLRRALEKKEFVLLYQPIVEGHDNVIVGVEALLRWNHPRLGLILPADFLPIAEESGLIIQIGEWVLYTACAQNKSWQELGLRPFKIAVNVSSQQFEQNNFATIIKKILKDTKLEPWYLELELTENLIIKNTKNTIMKMFELKEMGINLVIDDFGTGYSSLSYLRQFPVDKIKIDRSFISEILSNSSDLAIVLAIIGMANSLDLKTVAEGIETQEQLDYLKKHDMDEMQGFLFSKPLDADICTQFLKDKLD